VAALVGVDTLRLCSAWLAAMYDEKRISTVETWEIYVRAHFVPHFRDASELVSERRLAAYVTARLHKATAASVAKECSALQSLLRWCARLDVGYLTEAPIVPRPAKGVAGTRALEKVRVDLTPERAGKIIAALPVTVRAKERGGPARPCRAFFRVLWETGLRAGGLWRLEAPGDYHRGADELVIRDAVDKAAYGRILPLTAAARAALDEVCPKRGPIFGEPIDYRRQLARAARAAGVPGHLAGHVSPHDFRHGRTTDLLDGGASLTGVAYLMGHRQITTTNRYAHAQIEAARAALSGHRVGHGAGEPRRDQETRNAQAPAIAGASVVGHPGLEPGANGLRGESVERGAAVFRLLRGSALAPEGLTEPLSGHRVPIGEAALRYVVAYRSGDPFVLERGLDLAERVAEFLEGCAALEADREADVG